MSLKFHFVVFFLGFAFWNFGAAAEGLPPDVTDGNTPATITSTDTSGVKKQSATVSNTETKNTGLNLQTRQTYLDLLAQNQAALTETCNQQGEKLQKIISQCNKLVPGIANKIQDPAEVLKTCRNAIDECDTNFEAAMAKVNDTVDENNANPNDDVVDPDDDSPAAKQAAAAAKAKKMDKPITCPTLSDYGDSTTTSSDTSNTSSGTDKLKLTTACMHLKAQQQIDVLSHNQKSDIQDEHDRQRDFNATEDSLAKKTNDCQTKQADMNEKIAERNLDLKTVSAKEMTDLGGKKTEFTQALSNLQKAIDDATATEADINGPQMTAAVNAYNLAIAAAQKTCHDNLVKQGNANTLKFNTLQDALNASQVGLTSFKCDRDFDTQMARSVALQALNQQRQALQVKFLNQQNEIARLNRQLIILKSQLSNDDQKIALSAAAQMTADQTAITGLQQQLAASVASCNKTLATEEKRVEQDEDRAIQEKNDATPVACQLDYLKKKNPGLHANPKDDSVEAFDKLDDILTNSGYTPDPRCPKSTPPPSSDPASHG